jgi:mono/diheme cytochrome c family protein
LVWQSNIARQDLAQGQQLYTTNCAACHGETGAGDGVFANDLDQPETGEHADMLPGKMTTRPTDFTDSEHVLAASPAHLQGKILRGGMGTGMPYWGPIFTEEQTWALVAYLWTFQFELEDQP